jgi:AraC-like DNA-binding protein
MVGESLSVFGDHRDDDVARGIIEEAFLGDGASHETIARRFHLSRSAYFRRLQSATARLGAELRARNYA